VVILLIIIAHEIPTQFREPTTLRFYKNKDPFVSVFGGDRLVKVIVSYLQTGDFKYSREPNSQKLGWKMIPIK